MSDSDYNKEMNELDGIDTLEEIEASDLDYTNSTEQYSLMDGTPLKNCFRVGYEIYQMIPNKYDDIDDILIYLVEE